VLVGTDENFPPAVMAPEEARNDARVFTKTCALMASQAAHTGALASRAAASRGTSAPSRRASLAPARRRAAVLAARAARPADRRFRRSAAAAASGRDGASGAELADSDDYEYEDSEFFDDEDGGWSVDGELSVEELNAINDARSDANADGTYFDSYSHIGIHREMIGDAARTGAYLKALEGHADALKGKVVLDVGCGTGILSMFAARAGARKVYAVDASGITRHTRRLVKENGFENVIEVITARMEDVTAKDIPEPVDCVVSEWMGYALFFESMLPSVVHARDKFMRPGGLVLPNVADVRVALLEDQNRYDDGVSFWDDVYGFDFSSLASQTKRDWSSDPPVATVDPNCIVSDKEGALVVRVDCASVPLGDLYEPMAGTVELVAEKDCVAHGLCLWFDVDFYGRAFLSTSPSSTKTHWYQTVLMFEAPHAMRAGDALVANIELEPGSDPGAKRQLNVYANFDVVTAENARRKARDADETLPDDREHFAQWTVQ
jgi:2-polyprenyl-3-methyl-5-hydroxy-6-metoxy-1,4-benzoquinol methylase